MSYLNEREAFIQGGSYGDVTQGSAVQPGCDGSMYFPGATGTVVRLTPAPVDGGPQP
jgi:hypothetical protein